MSSVWERIHEALKERNGDPADQIAEYLIDERFDHSDLVVLVAWAVDHARRTGVRGIERSIATKESMDRFREGAAGGIWWEKIKNKPYRVGDGADPIPFNRLKIEQIDLRLAMLRKQQIGLQRSIEFLERARETIVTAGVECLADLE